MPFRAWDCIMEFVFVTKTAQEFTGGLSSVSKSQTVSVPVNPQNPRAGNSFKHRTIIYLLGFVRNP